MQLARYCFTETVQPRIGTRDAAEPLKAWTQLRRPQLVQRLPGHYGILTPWWRTAWFTCVLTVLPGLLSPVAYAGSNAVVWERDDQAVALAPQDDQTAPPNDHPVTIAPQVIEEMLAGLRLRYPNQNTGTPPVAVFNENQVDILGAALATGLARAGASQDVIFSVVGAHRLSPGAFAQRNRLTAGRVFVREGKLNLIFGEIQSPYRKKNIYGRTDEDFYPRKHGRRASAEEHESILIATASADLRSAPEGARGDWAVFDLALASVEPAPPPPPAATARAEAGPEPPDSPPTATDVPERSKAAPLPEAVDTAEIEQRLETLKRLREKELISEEAYRQKVDEILEKL